MPTDESLAVLAEHDGLNRPKGGRTEALVRLGELRKPSPASSVGNAVDAKGGWSVGTFWLVEMWGWCSGRMESDRLAWWGGMSSISDGSSS